MTIKCVRCGKEIEKADASNAKYIVNSTDKKTWGKDKVEKWFVKSSNPNKLFKSEAFRTFEEAEGKKKGRGNLESDDIVLEYVEIYRPKTAIVCSSCIEKKDIIIW